MKRNTLFRKDESIQAILYVASKYQKKDIHKICKTLYFADQEHLSKYGRSITGDTYIAMSFGPVPSSIEDIFKAMRGGYFEQYVNDIRQYFDFINDYCIRLNKEADLDYLSESDIECLDNAIVKCNGKSFNELTEMSHDYAWSNTRKDRSMSVKDILREAGDDEDYASYISEKLKLEESFA